MCFEGTNSATMHKFEAHMCPHCESTQTVSNIYNYKPEEKLMIQHLIRKGKARIASASRNSRMTHFHCNNCGYNFAPVHPKFDFADIRALNITFTDNVYGEILMEFATRGDTIQAKICKFNQPTKLYQVKKDCWDRCLQLILHKTHLYNWYTETKIFNETRGKTWKVEIHTRVDMARHLIWSGKNAFPPYWSMFIHTITRDLITDEILANELLAKMAPIEKVSYAI